MKYAIGLLIWITVIASSPLQAAVGVISGAEVLRTRIADDGRWGGCMALVSQDLASAGLNCANRWVSFSCTGDFTPKDNAYKMFDAAQMAMALDLKVFLIVDDGRKHNGVCYGGLIDLLPTTP